MSTFKEFVQATKPFVNKPIKYCFLDFDGTIRQTTPEGWAPDKVEDIVIYPWVAERLKEIANKGYMIVGMTNQQYLVNKLGEAAVDTICRETVHKTGMEFPYIFSHTPEENKPSTFMYKKVEQMYGPADKSSSIMVGDLPAKDGEGAKNFGIKYVTAQELKDGKIP